MHFPDIQMTNGTILKGEKISELATMIINKFADEGLTRDESIEVLKATEGLVGEYSYVNKVK